MAICGLGFSVLGYVLIVPFCLYYPYHFYHYHHYRYRYHYHHRYHYIIIIIIIIIINSIIVIIIIIIIIISSGTILSDDATLLPRLCQQLHHQEHSFTQEVLIFLTKVHTKLEFMFGISMSFYPRKGYK